MAPFTSFSPKACIFSKSPSFSLFCIPLFIYNPFLPPPSLLSHLHLIFLSYWTTSLPSSLSSFSLSSSNNFLCPPPTLSHTTSLSESLFRLLPKMRIISTRGLHRKGLKSKQHCMCIFWTHMWQFGACPDVSSIQPAQSVWSELFQSHQSSQDDLKPPPPKHTLILQPTYSWVSLLPWQMNW